MFWSVTSFRFPVSIERPTLPARARKEKMHIWSRMCHPRAINGKFRKACIAYIWKYRDRTRQNIYELNFIVVDHEIRLESVRYSTVLSRRGEVFPLREILQILANLSKDLLLFKVKSKLANNPFWMMEELYTTHLPNSIPIDAHIREIERKHHVWASGDA